MFSHVNKYYQAITHLFFPHNCLGCYTDVLHDQQFLCARCFSTLPETGFFSHPGNMMEKIFYGRLPIQEAGCAYYFNHDSLLHKLVLQFKYQGRKDIGVFLGKLMMSQFILSARFKNIDLIIPLPLNKQKELARGYNQSQILAEEISEALHIPVISSAVTRKKFTETQTKKSRIDRWENMQNIFDIGDPSLLQNKHILLVDDIITTGATLEGCGLEILNVPGTKLSIATLAITV